MTKIGEEQQPQLITLTNLQVATQTSKPSSLTINGKFELEPAPQSWLQQGWEEDMKPKSGSISATLQGSGITVKLSNAQISDFVLDEGDCPPPQIGRSVGLYFSISDFSRHCQPFLRRLGCDCIHRSKSKLNITTLNGDWTAKCWEST
jgi:hypothetical protein